MSLDIPTGLLPRPVLHTCVLRTGLWASPAAPFLRRLWAVVDFCILSVSGPLEGRLVVPTMSPYCPIAVTSFPHS